MIRKRQSPATTMTNPKSSLANRNPSNMLDDQDWRSTRMNPFTPTLEAIWLKPSCVWVNSPAVVSVGASIASDQFSIPDWRESVFPEEDLVFLDFIGVG